MLGIYVHVPFCLRKCPYCSFYSVGHDEAVAQRYVDALCRNIARYRGCGYTADTLYFGGGTPSVLTAGQISRIVEECRKAFTLQEAEITLEANPSSVDEDKLGELRVAGVNRISFGIQSADNSRLAFLGRLHDYEAAENAVKAAKKVGFENISADLMLGAAGESCDSLRGSIDKLCDLPLTHVSAYMLKIEQGTPFDNDEIKSQTADDDLMSELYLTAVAKLEKHGFMQYEISNFAKAGMESRHNNKYWLGEEYLGFGSSAHSYFRGVRFCCPADVKEYIESDVQPREVLEEAPNRAEEYILLGLRLTSGISLDRVAELYSNRAAAHLQELAKTYAAHGLLTLTDRSISLTPQGFLVSNSIIEEFINAVDI